GHPDAIAVTASTGLAASLIGGRTLHSFAAIGLAKENERELARKVQSKEAAVELWKKTQVLIIDESELPLHMISFLSQW
ncbi:hypothetical protein CALCODRAFT_431036, partial [Calocera cornea HHB12733]